MSILVIAALGVVFGDIGTSPLYTMRAVLLSHGDIASEETAVMGAISMIAWCLIVIVMFTYVGVITRADNEGEGGIIALATYLVRRSKASKRTAALVLVIAMIGASLFLGDSLITPAISVLSAAEGLTVVNSELGKYVVPFAVIVLALLFIYQRKGTERIGKVFGPVMALWFITMGVLGIPWIVSNAGILRALSPTYAIAFAIETPWVAFIALGATVLAVTGAEALYADLGHFGRKPILLSWMFLVFPCLLLNYFGQGALILSNPHAAENPFFMMAPEWGLIPLVILATCATVIASQAVISGAFSVVRQAVRLSLLPRFKVVQTSASHGGQVYLPAVNAILFVGVLLLVVTMQSSEALASAYGIAITGTLLLELSLFLVFARVIWKWSLVKIVAMGVFVGGLELLLFAANTLKIVSGGWFPIAISTVTIIVMVTWNRGARIMFGRRKELEGSLEDFVEQLDSCDIQRVPGIAVYPHGDRKTVPLALRSSISFSRTIHEHVVIINVKNVGIPHVKERDRVTIDSLGSGHDGIVQVLYKVGFMDSQDVPRALRLAIGSTEELAFNPSEAWYVLSVFRIEPADSDKAQEWPKWQRGLFRALERMSANRTQAFHLPPERTIINGAEVTI